ncbi:MAG: cytochrome c [Chloroflexi bacterium]|nr:cytochrome c [Chloroflexota bacterium]
MSNILKIVLAIAGALMAIVVVAVIVVVVSSNGVLNETYDVEVAAISIPTDAESLAEGERLTWTWGCWHCHGEDLGGQEFLDDGAIGYLYATNLTGAPGSPTESYDTLDWIGAIRHGIKPDNSSIVIMPSYEYTFMTDEDLGRMVAYLESLEPIEREASASESWGPVGRMLLLAGELPVSAALINHDAERLASLEPAATVEYGEYLAVGCEGCHGTNYSGGPLPGGTDLPPAPNLTPTDDGLADWTLEEFTLAMREGVSRDGSGLNPVHMPWPGYAFYTDVEMEAIWLFLQDLPPLAYNTPTE